MGDSEKYDIYFDELREIPLKELEEMYQKVHQGTSKPEWFWLNGPWVTRRQNAMTFHEYQEATSKTAIYKQEIDTLTDEVEKGLLGGFTPGSSAALNKVNKELKICYTALGLGEVGEVQGKIKKIIRDAKGEITEDIRMKIAHELGDVLWYVSQLCDELDLSLEMVADINVTKLKSRMERGVIKGSGDNR